MKSLQKIKQAPSAYNSFLALIPFSNEFNNTDLI